MEALLDARLHRCVPLPDVMIASLAVVQRLTVLHHDRDFDRIKQVYGEFLIGGPWRRGRLVNVRAAPGAESS